MKSMPSGQYVPGESAMHRLDARAKVIGLFLLLAAIVAASTPPGYLLMIGAVACVVFAAKLPLQAALSPVRRLWLFCLLIFGMNALFFDGASARWSWGFLRVSSEGIFMGARVALNVLLVVVLANALATTTAPMETTSALVSLLGPLKLLRAPVEDVAMILSVAMRFVPALLEEADMIKKAQTARGARFESKRLAERATSFLPLVVPLFLSAFRRADELSVAMEARGYKNARNRTQKPRKRFGKGDIAALSCCLAVCLLQIFFIR